MNELVRGLTNLRSLRAAVRELTLEQAENALEKLQTAIEEKRANEAELIKAETERKERLATPTLFEALVITEITKDLPPISSSFASLSTISLNLTPTACRSISRLVKFDISLGNDISICSFMTFLFRVSFPCILLDILSLSRLCGRLSPFLRNLRTNRKLTYYTQL